MNFSDKDKLAYWVFLIFLTSLTLFVCTYMGIAKDIIKFFIFLLVGLTLLPLVSEISFLGLSIRKEIQDFKADIRESLVDIKNSINFSPTINNNIGSPTEASPEERREKIKDEIIKGDLEEKKMKEKEIDRAKSSSKNGPSYTLNDAPPSKSQSDNFSIQQRIEKTLVAEELVNGFLLQKFIDYDDHKKFTNRDTLQDFIVDGVIMKSFGIKEIIEIKYFQSYVAGSLYNGLYFQLVRYLERITRFGLRIPVRFIFVSEEMTDEFVDKLEEQVNKLKAIKKVARNMPHIHAMYLLLKDGQIEELRN